MNAFGLQPMNRKTWSAALQSPSVPEPPRFISMHEPPATACFNQFYHGHCARGQADKTRRRLRRDVRN